MRNSVRSFIAFTAAAVLMSVGVVSACSSSTVTRASSPNAVAGAKGLLAVLSPTIKAGDAGSGEIDAMITNAATTDDALIGVTVPSSLASGATVDRIPVPSGGLVTLSAGGPHVNLTGMKGVSPRSTVSMTFVFEKVGEITVNAVVR
jgi:copper(I)-binding protein